MQLVSNAPDPGRTGNLRNRNPLLYPLSYGRLPFFLLMPISFSLFLSLMGSYLMPFLLFSAGHSSSLLRWFC